MLNIMFKDINQQFDLLAVVEVMRYFPISTYDTYSNNTNNFIWSMMYFKLLTVLNFDVNEALYDSMA